MRQLDNGLGGIILTRVVAAKLFWIDTRVLEQGMERRFVNAMGRVFGDLWRGAAEEEVDLGDDTEAEQLVVNAAVWDVAELGDVVKDVSGVVCDEGCEEGSGCNGSAEDVSAWDEEFEWGECRVSGKEGRVCWWGKSVVYPSCPQAQPSPRIISRSKSPSILSTRSSAHAKALLRRLMMKMLSASATINTSVWQSVNSIKTGCWPTAYMAAEGGLLCCTPVLPNGLLECSGTAEVEYHQCLPPPSTSIVSTFSVRWYRSRPSTSR
eukprot:148424-Rhodomonas_salina.1